MGEVKLPDKSFNLITKPWLPVIKNGELVQVGLQEALLQPTSSPALKTLAHSFRTH